MLYVAKMTKLASNERSLARESFGSFEDLSLSYEGNPLGISSRSVGAANMDAQNNVETIDNVKVKALKLCRDYLQGAWKIISEDQFKIQRISGGLSNHIFLCSLPPSVPVISGEPSNVLLRLYGHTPGSSGPSGDGFPDVEATNRLIAIHVIDNVVFTLLSERGLGPKLFGVFPEGRLEEFIPSRSMMPSEMSSPIFSDLIARKMAKIHALSVPISKEPNWLPKTLNRYLKQIDAIALENVPKDQRSLAKKLLKFDFAGEIEWLLKFLSFVNSPVVFCHNDVQGGNILICDEASSANRLMIIDYEFCGYNYRAFDIANHFCEWAYDYTYDKFPFYLLQEEAFPTKEKMIAFFHSYLSEEGQLSFKLGSSSELVSNENSDSLPKSDARDSRNHNNNNNNSQQHTRGRKRRLTLDQQIEKLLREVNAFVLAPCLLWCMWGMTQSVKSGIPFGYWHYSTKRMQQYLDHKVKVVAQMEMERRSCKKSENEC